MRAQEKGKACPKAPEPTKSVTSLPPQSPLWWHSQRSVRGRAMDRTVRGSREGAAGHGVWSPLQRIWSMAAGPIRAPRPRLMESAHRPGLFHLTVSSNPSIPSAWQTAQCQIKLCVCLAASWTPRNLGTKALASSFPGRRLPQGAPSSLSCDLGRVINELSPSQGPSRLLHQLGCVSGRPVESSVGAQERAIRTRQPKPEWRC